MKYLYDSGGAFKTQSDPMCYLMIGRDQNFIKNFRFFQDDDKDVVCSNVWHQKNPMMELSEVSLEFIECANWKKNEKKSFWIKRVMVQKMMDGLVKSQNYWIL